MEIEKILAVVILVLIIMFAIRGRPKETMTITGTDGGSLLAQMAGSNKMFAIQDQPNQYITIIPARGGLYHLLSFELSNGEPSKELPLVNLTVSSDQDNFSFSTPPESRIQYRASFELSPPHIINQATLTFPGADPNTITQRINPEVLANPLPQEHVWQIIQFAMSANSSSNGNGAVGGGAVSNGSTPNGSTPNGSTPNGSTPNGVASGAIIRLPASGLFENKQCSII